jgi:hypothetical protein
VALSFTLGSVDADCGKTNEYNNMISWTYSPIGAFIRFAPVEARGI